MRTVFVFGKRKTRKPGRRRKGERKIGREEKTKKFAYFRSKLTY